MKHVRDGEDFFSGSHNSDHEAFGFHGSLTPLPTERESPQRPDSPATKGGKGRPEPVDEYAHGGKVHPHHHPHGHEVARVEERDGMKIEHHAHGGMTCHHAGGEVTHHHHDGTPVHAAMGGSMGPHMHPHGHDVMRVEHRTHDGAVVHHHRHGGHTVHHGDGRVTHHHEDGSPVHAAHGGHMEHHDSEAEYAHGGHHRAPHEDAAQDRAMIKDMIMKHDKGEHLARGGMARLPRDMKPPAMRPHSPVETAPRKPQVTRTPSNAMPGGEMGYGSQPSAEPGYEATSPTGATAPGMRRGGRA